MNVCDRFRPEVIFYGLFILACVSCSNGMLSTTGDNGSNGNSGTGFKKAYLITTSNGPIIITHTTPYNSWGPGSQFTIELLVKPMSFPIIQHLYSDNAGFDLFLNTNGTFVVNYPNSTCNGSFAGLTSPTALVAGYPYFLAVTAVNMGGTIALTLYKNGVLENFSNVGSAPPTACSPNTAHVGSDNSGLGVFKGIIDELRVSNITRAGANLNYPTAPLQNDPYVLFRMSFDNITAGGPVEYTTMGSTMAFPGINGIDFSFVPSPF